MMSVNNIRQMQDDSNGLTILSIFAKLLGLVVCVTLSSQCFGQPPQPTKTTDELMAFAHLSSQLIMAKPR